ncbi:hypothetical protein ABZP36_003451 [Zizania latifolia]
MYIDIIPFLKKKEYARSSANLLVEEDILHYGSTTMGSPSKGMQNCQHKVCRCLFFNLSSYEHLHAKRVSYTMFCASSMFFLVVPSLKSRYEEFFLRQFFGHEYEEYARKVHSGLPFIE